MNNSIQISFSRIFIIFINFTLFQFINCHFFKSEKMDIDLKEMLREQINQEKLGDTNECLVSEEETKIILKEKYKLNPDIEIDQNISFILGKCYTILYIPVFYASRMVANISCPELKKIFYIL